MSDANGADKIRAKVVAAEEVKSELQSARDKLVELEPKIRGDMREIYSEEYLQAASVLFREDPVEFRGLQNRLRGRGVHKGDFERKVREFYRIQEQASQATAAAAPGGASQRESQATALVKLVQSRAELFHHGDDCYATIEVSGHRETHSLKSRKLSRWLSFEYMQSNSTAPNAQSISAATSTLSGEAMYKGPERSVFVRVARHEDKAYLDLCDADWRVVEIDRDGWRVIDSEACSVRFRRAHGMQALPVPKPDGSVTRLRDFVNVANDHDFKLIVGWLVAALRSTGPYPILTVTGEPGAAKSTTARVLRELVDPNLAPLRSEPRDIRDLMIAATNGWVVAFDNLSRITGSLSDALCRLATGGGNATRELFSDGDEVIFNVQRPVLTNSIVDLMSRGDLLERAIVMNLPRINEARRRTETEFYRDFNVARPHILGALLDGVCAAMREADTIKLKHLPRMADFAVWVEATAPAFGWKPREFLTVYAGNQDDANSLALETPVAQAIQKFIMAQPEAAAGRCWLGEATDLLRELDHQFQSQLEHADGKVALSRASRPKGWPESPRVLSNALHRLAPNLRRIDIDIKFHRKGHDRRRIIEILYSGNDRNPSSASSAVEENIIIPKSFPNPDADEGPYAGIQRERPQLADPAESPTTPTPIATADDADDENPLIKDRPDREEF